MLLVEVPGTNHSQIAPGPSSYQITKRRSGRSNPTASQTTKVVKKSRRRRLLHLNVALPVVALLKLFRDVVHLTNWWAQRALESVRSGIVSVNVNVQSAIVNVANVTNNIHVVFQSSAASNQDNVDFEFSLDEDCSENSESNQDYEYNVEYERETTEFEYQETFRRVTVDQTELKLSRAGDVGGFLMANLAEVTRSLRNYLGPAATSKVKTLGAVLLGIWFFQRVFTYMLLYPIFRLLFGTLYPAYASYKAVKSKNVKEYVKWMMYWIVFALFTCAETITDVFLSWFPFYYEIKIILVIWLLSPATKGSSFLYRKFVHPMLSSREQEIDEYISKAKEQSYKQVLDIGQKGVNALMQTALKGGGGLVNQIRKSYSLSDLTDPRHAAHDDDAISEIDGAPLRKRSPSKKRAAGISTSMYFSEIDVRTEGIVSIQSADDISSGYSSNETLLQLAGQSLPKLQQREALARGASMKVRPTRVTRAAAVSATKKSATTDEVGSTTLPRVKKPLKKKTL